jgi:hypothetical protein
MSLASPWGRSCLIVLGFFLKPNRFAHGEKFFMEEK